MACSVARPRDERQPSFTAAPNRTSPAASPGTGQLKPRGWRADHRCPLLGARSRRLTDVEGGDPQHGDSRKYGLNLGIVATHDSAEGVCRQLLQDGAPGLWTRRSTCRRSLEGGSARSRVCDGRLAWNTCRRSPRPDRCPALALHGADAGARMHRSWPPPRPTDRTAVKRRKPTTGGGTIDQRQLGLVELQVESGNRHPCCCRNSPHNLLPLPRRRAAADDGRENSPSMSVRNAAGRRWSRTAERCRSEPALARRSRPTPWQPATSDVRTLSALRSHSGHGTRAVPAMGIGRDSQHGELVRRRLECIDEIDEESGRMFRLAYQQRRGMARE